MRRNVIWSINQHHISSPYNMQHKKDGQYSYFVHLRYAISVNANTTGTAIKCKFIVKIPRFLNDNNIKSIESPACVWVSQNGRVWAHYLKTNQSEYQTREHEAATQPHRSIIRFYSYIRKAHSQPIVFETETGQSGGGSEVAGDRLAFVPVLTVAARTGKKEKQLCAHSVHLCAVSGMNYFVK